MCGGLYTDRLCALSTQPDEHDFGSLQLSGWIMDKRRRRYSPAASKDVEAEMHRYKRGTLRSGPGGKGGKVKSRKQAIAIGLSKARKAGKKVPCRAS